METRRPMMWVLFLSLNCPLNEYELLSASACNSSVGQLWHFDGLQCRSRKMRHSEILNMKPQLESLFKINSNLVKWTGATASEMKEECQDLLKKMETTCQKVEYITLDNLCLEVTSWNWKNTKNKTHNWGLLSMIAVVEKYLVTFYCWKLLTNFIAGQQLRVVYCTGNPGVFLGVPVPLPGKTCTPDQEYGFLRGTNVQTPGSPIPVPLAGYPWVFAIFQ